AAIWDLQGVGTRFGPHTNARTGIHISARELARFGYLMMHRGRWRDRQIVPEEWIAKITAPSQTLNPSYGYTWWTNGNGTLWSGLPRGLFACQGLHCNGCWAIPSLDLVVARTGETLLQHPDLPRQIDRAQRYLADVTDRVRGAVPRVETVVEVGD